MYSTGEVFTYTYDAVGNRLGDGAPSGANVYAYDNANRLTAVNGTSNTWDANGNLLNDGVLTYTYDAANRLVAINANLYTFGYNGQGDRLLQNANGTPITYTLDLAAGLTQVLAEKKGTTVTTYIYGLARLAQRPSAGTEYYLADGLGSMRELANANGNVTLQKSYDPYGQTLSSSGTSSSSYDFTGEYRDQSGLIYLRARYYAGRQGRFIQKDNVNGDYARPQSLNAWAYVGNNSINLTDPRGLRPCDDFINGQCITYCPGPGTGNPPPEADPNQVEWDTYYALLNHEGWWKNGRQNFTLWDFLELLLWREFTSVADSYVGPLKEQETAVRNFYYRCLSGNCDNKNPADIMTHIRRKQLLAQHSLAVPKGADPSGIWLLPENNGKTDYAHAFRHPDPWWSLNNEHTNNPATGNVPVEWGNEQMVYSLSQARYYAHNFALVTGRSTDGGYGTNDDNVYARSGNPPYINELSNFWFIMTDRQLDFWYCANQAGCGSQP